MKAIVLFSGGQDSATCLMYALTQCTEIVALSFDYGQRHKQELKMAGRCLSQLHDITDQKITHIIRSVQFERSSLLDKDSDINAPHELDNTLPSSFVPGRNLLFLTIAASIARVRGIRKIYTGVCQTDYSGYPDCRDETIKALQKALNLGLFTDDKGHIHISTPLMFLNKADTWAMAKQIGSLLGIDGVKFIVENTLTDYNGDMTPNEWGYGKEDNPASILRANGYREAKRKGKI